MHDNKQIYSDSNVETTVLDAAPTVQMLSNVCFEHSSGHLNIRE